MTKKALDANELLCHNNTVKTHHVNRSDLKKKTWLSKQNIWLKKQFFLFPTKFIRISKTSPMTKTALYTNELLCHNQHHSRVTLW